VNGELLSRLVGFVMGLPASIRDAPLSLGDFATPRWTDATTSYILPRERFFTTGTCFHHPVAMTTAIHRETETPLALMARSLGGTGKRSILHSRVANLHRHQQSRNPTRPRPGKVCRSAYRWLDERVGVRGGC